MRVLDWTTPPVLDFSGASITVPILEPGERGTIIISNLRAIKPQPIDSIIIQLIVGSFEDPRAMDRPLVLLLGARTLRSISLTVQSA